MAQPKIQTSFASGEWTPELFARVDLQKYHNGAALLRNFFVDYHGGASTRMGTRYLLQCLNSSSKVRLIPFQVSQTIGYVLEFGNFYIRFYINGAPVLETATAAATGLTAGGVVTVANTYNVGDWVQVNGFGGVTAFNGNFYQVSAATPTQVTLVDLNGNPITVAGTWTSGGTLQRVYTISSPYSSTDLGTLKYAQSVTQMMIVHPNYQPRVLTINSATNWTLAIINFGPTVAPPTLGGVSSTLPAGTFTYGYVVTAVDSNGTESAPSNVSSASSLAYIGSSVGSNNLSWSAVSGATSYNVYKALPISAGSLPASTQFGFIGNVTGTTFVESYPGIGADFGQTPPIVQGAFAGGTINGTTVTSAATYTVVPSIAFPAPSTPGGITATGYASLGATSVSIASHDGAGYDVVMNAGGNPTGAQLLFGDGVAVTITSVTLTTIVGAFWGYVVNSVSLQNPGSVVGAGNSVPSNPQGPQAAPTVFKVQLGLTFNFTWGVQSITQQINGSGYTTGGSVAFSPAGATATFSVTPLAGGPTAQNPSVVSFFQQRMVLGATNGNLQGFSMSQPGAFFNFNTTNPVQADDAIEGSIVNGQLNQIKSFINVPTGLMTFTSRGAWLISGGAGNPPTTPLNVTATTQAVVGASDLPPLQVNYDAIYGQAKGYYVRDITFNFYVGVYTGNDISIISSHLFYGYQLTEWTWAEEPFKTIWAIRSDGTLLSLAYVKEQETIGWAHHDTNGQFMSVTSVVEALTVTNPSTGPTQILVDAVYVVVQRVVQGVTLQYVERMADRIFPYGVEDAWCVDAGLQTKPNFMAFGNLTGNLAAASGNGVLFTGLPAGSWQFQSFHIGYTMRVSGAICTITSLVGPPGTNQVLVNITTPATFVNPYTNIPYPDNEASGWAPVTTVSGLTHLVGQQVVGLADGTPVGPLTVSAAGTVTLPQAATKIVLGLAFTPQLQTLQLDLGEPTAQGKRKKISACTVRCRDTLGLQFGTSFTTLVTMKDFIIGNVGSASNKIVAGLVTADARTIADPLWQVPGQYCLQQPLPYPATILGVIPEIEAGDTPK